MPDPPIPETPRPMTVMDPFVSRFRARLGSSLFRGESWQQQPPPNRFAGLVPHLNLDDTFEANMELLTFGSTSGDATKVGHTTIEAMLGTGFNALGNQPTTGQGNLQVASRTGLFPGAEGGITLGTGLFGAPSPSSALGTFHVGTDNIGLYFQGGVQRDPVTNQLTYAVGGNLAGTQSIGTKETGLTKLYENFMYNAGGIGQISNANVSNYAGMTALFGLSRARANSSYTGGFEILGTLGQGTDVVTGLSRTSVTGTALGYLQRQIGAHTWGIAGGVSYESGGGGFGGFLRLGIGLDRSSTPVRPYIGIDSEY